MQHLWEGGTNQIIERKSTSVLFCRVNLASWCDTARPSGQVIRDQSSWREWVPILQPKMYVLSTLLCGEGKDKQEYFWRIEGGSPSVVFRHIAVLGSFKQTLCITSPGSLGNGGHWVRAYQENNGAIHQRDKIILCFIEENKLWSLFWQIGTFHLQCSYRGW